MRPTLTQPVLWRFQKKIYLFIIRLMSKNKLKVVDTEKLPVCPHCNKEMETIERVEWFGLMKNSCVYMCPHCRKILQIVADYGN